MRAFAKMARCAGWKSVFAGLHYRKKSLTGRSTSTWFAFRTLTTVAAAETKTGLSLGLHQLRLQRETREEAAIHRQRLSGDAPKRRAGNQRRKVSAPPRLAFCQAFLTDRSAPPKPRRTRTAPAIPRSRLASLKGKSGIADTNNPTSTSDPPRKCVCARVMLRLAPHPRPYAPVDEEHAKKEQRHRPCWQPRRARERQQDEQSPEQQHDKFAQQPEQVERSGHSTRQT